MSDRPFGRQLLPVTVTITGGKYEDRDHWASRLKGYLSNQPCDVQAQPTLNDKRQFKIYPDANND